jgi:hypothetical protein
MVAAHTHAGNAIDGDQGAQDAGVEVPASKAVKGSSLHVCSSRAWLGMQQQEWQKTLLVGGSPAVCSHHAGHGCTDSSAGASTVASELACNCALVPAGQQAWLHSFVQHYSNSKAWMQCTAEAQDGPTASPTPPSSLALHALHGEVSSSITSQARQQRCLRTALFVTCRALAPLWHSKLLFSWMSRTYTAVCLSARRELRLSCRQKGQP